MKIDNNNYNEMNRIRRELLAVLDNQFETLPADWDVYDHAMVVLHVAIGEMMNCGVVADAVRDEVEAFLSVFGKESVGKDERDMH
jgi:hypothetical protein